MNFRQAAGTQLHRISTAIEGGFSNFLFIDQHYASNPVLRRIFSLARKNGFRSVLIDEITEAQCALLTDENRALATRRGDFQRSEVHRISFFRCRQEEAPAAADFIGYVVFKRDFFAGQLQPRVHVFESVMAPTRGLQQNNFIHCQRDYTVTTSLGEFSVRGVLYAQQNDTTFVCAHVGLRSALSTVLPDGDITYTAINNLVGIDHTTRRVGMGVGGLEPADMENVLNGLNLPFDKVVHEPSRQLILPTEYQRDLYGGIESGFPALVGFELEDPAATPTGAPRHVIPCFGHTFNEDTWLPEAQRAYFGNTLSYYPSENWLSTYIVHDDNFGPYLCLPRHFLKKDNFRLLYALKQSPTGFTAVQAEALGFAFSDAIARRHQLGIHDWFDRFSVFTRRGWLVLRTILTKKDAYLKHLEHITAWDGRGVEKQTIDRLRAGLPQLFWQVEASAPELFNASRRKFGEVLLPCDRPLPPQLDSTLLLGARFPGLFYIQQTQGQFQVVPTQLTSHTDLFTLSST